MFILRRGSVYYFRRRVPDALRASLGKREVIKSLKTSDRSIALQRASDLFKKTTVQFDALSRKLGASRYSSLTAEEISQFVANYIALRLQEIDELKRTVSQEFLEDALSHLVMSCEERSRTTKEANRLGRFDTFDEVLPKFLLEQGILLAPDFGKRDRDALNFAFLRANVLLVNYEEEALRGEVVTIPDYKPFIPVNSFTISDAFTIWSSNTNRNPKTLKELTRLTKLFSDYHGGDLRSLTRQQVYGFFQDRQHLARATLVKEAGLLGALCSMCVEQEFLSVNPFEGLKISFGKASLKKDDFTKADITRIFSHVKISDDPEMFLFATLALITGARLEELAQLRTTDFKLDGEILYFSVDTFDGKTTKNVSSIRLVPIHKAYRNFIENHVSKCSGHIFDVKQDLNHRFGSAIGKRFNRFVRINLNLPVSKTLHCFRHTFKTLSREHEIPTEIHDAITGHVTKGEGQKYGKYSMSTLYKAVSRIQFQE